MNAREYLSYILSSKIPYGIGYSLAADDAIEWYLTHKDELARAPYSIKVGILNAILEMLINEKQIHEIITKDIFNHLVAVLKTQPEGEVIGLPRVVISNKDGKQYIDLHGTPGYGFAYYWLFSIDKVKEAGVGIIFGMGSHTPAHKTVVLGSVRFHPTKLALFKYLSDFKKEIQEKSLTKELISPYGSSGILGKNTNRYYNAARLTRFANCVFASRQHILSTHSNIKQVLTTNNAPKISTGDRGFDVHINMHEVLTEKARANSDPMNNQINSPLASYSILAKSISANSQKITEYPYNEHGKRLRPDDCENEMSIIKRQTT